MTPPIFKQRLGPDPHAGGRQSTAAKGCPDLWELESGDIAVIGIRIPTAAILPASAGCGPDEEVVIVPRDVFLRARPDINKLDAS